MQLYTLKKKAPLPTNKPIQIGNLRIHSNIHFNIDGMHPRTVLFEQVNKKGDCVQSLLINYRPSGVTQTMTRHDKTGYQQHVIAMGKNLSSLDIESHHYTKGGKAVKDNYLSLHMPEGFPLDPRSITYTAFDGSGYKPKKINSYEQVKKIFNTKLTIHDMAREMFDGCEKFKEENYDLTTIRGVYVSKANPDAIRVERDCQMVPEGLAKFIDQLSQVTTPKEWLQAVFNSIPGCTDNAFALKPAESLKAQVA